MAQAKSALAAIPEPLEGDELLAKKSNCVDDSDVPVLPSTSSSSGDGTSETMEVESSLPPFSS